MAAAAVTSAAPLLALLEEEDDKLKVHALKQLDDVVPRFWFQISKYIPQVEALCEDTEFDHRERASLLVSKVPIQPSQDSPGCAAAMPDDVRRLEALHINAAVRRGIAHALMKACVRLSSCRTCELGRCQCFLAIHFKPRLQQLLALELYQSESSRVTM